MHVLWPRPVLATDHSSRSFCCIKLLEVTTDYLCYRVRNFSFVVEVFVSFFVELNPGIIGVWVQGLQPKGTHVGHTLRQFEACPEIHLHNKQSKLFYWTGMIVS